MRQYWPEEHCNDASAEQMREEEEGEEERVEVKSKLPASLIRSDARLDSPIRLAATRPAVGLDGSSQSWDHGLSMMTGVFNTCLATADDHVTRGTDDRMLHDEAATHWTTTASLHGLPYGPGESITFLTLHEHVPTTL